MKSFENNFSEGVKIKLIKWSLPLIKLKSDSILFAFSVAICILAVFGCMIKFVKDQITIKHTFENSRK